MGSRFEATGVLATGARSEIGREAARLFAIEGACLDVRAERLGAVVDEIGEEDTVAIPCDIAGSAACDSAIAHSVDRFGTLEVLCGIAGGHDAWLHLSRTRPSA